MFIEMKIEPSICVSLIDSWKQEHEKYYGKPCGLSQPKALERPEELKKYTNREPEWGFSCGYNKVGELHIWVRSFGSWTGVTPDGQLIAGGRRHALQAQLAEFSDDIITSAQVIKVVSQEPNRGLFE
jgi:hypothetical protein